MNKINVKEILPLNIDNNTVFNIVTKDVNYLTHGFHKYPAKFIPQVPSWAINKYLDNTTDKVILDPFCGSGTTLVEGVIAGHNVIGIDIDPLSSLISKVKITPLNLGLLDDICTKLRLLLSEKNNAQLFCPECSNLQHWFTIETIGKLSKIRSSIDKILKDYGNTDEIKDIYEFLIICFSSIIRKVSNADNESQKTYVSHTKIKIPAEVFTTFDQQLSYFIDRIKLFSTKVQSNRKKIIINASNVATTYDELADIDLVISSPPYIKSVDYVYNQMAELFWIGDLFEMQTQLKQNIFKKQYIGTMQVLKKEYSKYNPSQFRFGIDELDNNLKNVFKIDQKNGHKYSYITYKYFNDMDKHFKLLSKKLKTGVHYIMVVGNSSVSGIEFNTAQYLIALAGNNNLRLVNKWGYKIKNRFMRFNRNGKGGLIEIDWVLDFVKI